MPNRIIHEKALRSDTLAKLSAEAERLFWRLTAVADDQGRFDAYPTTVKADCFPRMVDSIKTERVAYWLLELGAEICKYYTVNGRTYGVFVNWGEYQRIYGNKPKFPDPPMACEETAISAADSRSSPQIPAVPRSSRESAALILIPTPTSIPTSTSTSTTNSPSSMDDFDRFWESYPRKVGKEAARKAWRKYGGTRPPLDVILAAVQQQRESEQWKKDQGQYIPNPATWINQGRWADRPTVVSGASDPNGFLAGMKSFIERG